MTELVRSSSVASVSVPAITATRSSSGAKRKRIVRTGQRTVDDRRRIVEAVLTRIAQCLLGQTQRRLKGP